MIRPNALRIVKQLQTTPLPWSMLLLLILFYTLFPTLRVLIIGTENAKNAWEYMVSALPDVALVGLTAYLFLQFRKHMNSIRFQLVDLIVFFVFSCNVVLGSVLSQDLKLIVLGTRMTYLPMIMYACARLMQGNDFEVQYKLWLQRVMLWFTLWSALGLLFYLCLPNLQDQWMEFMKANNGAYFIPRLNSIYYSPTVNGIFCATSCTYFLLQSVQKPKGWNLLWLSINFCALLLSMSRGGIVIYLFIMCIVFVYFFKKWKSLLLLLGTQTVVFLVTLQMVGLSLGNFYWVFSSTKETLELQEKVTRVQLWKDTFSHLQHKPGGYGIGKSGWIAYRFLKDTNVESAYLATDGWYLKLANETGFFGLISFTFLFLFLLFRLFFAKNKGASFFFFLVMTMVFMVNVVSNVLDYFMFNAIFWFLMGAYQNGCHDKPVFSKVLTE